MVQAREQQVSKFRKEMSEFVKSMLIAQMQSGEIYDIFDSMTLDPDLKVYMENHLVANGLMRTQ